LVAPETHAIIHSDYPTDHRPSAWAPPADAIVTWLSMAGRLEMLGVPLCLLAQWLGPAAHASHPPQAKARWRSVVLIQRHSGLSKQLSYEDSEWDDRSILFHEGCPWLYEVNATACAEDGLCTRRLECEMSRPLRLGAFTVPAVAVVLAVFAMMRTPKDSDLARPINWGLNRLPCRLTRFVAHWFGAGVFPPVAAASGLPPAPELAVALYLVGLLGWLFLMHGVRYMQPTPLDVPEYLHLVANTCLRGDLACGHGSSLATAGFKAVRATDGQQWLELPYPTRLLLGARLVPLTTRAGKLNWAGLDILAVVRVATFAGILSTIFGLLLSRLCRGSAVTVFRTIAAVGSSVFCLGFAALEAVIRWHGHVWIAPAFANVGVAVFCIFLVAGVDAAHFLARWAFYGTLVPLYFSDGVQKLKAGGLRWSACSHWAEHELQWDVPLPDFTRFIISHSYTCIAVTVSGVAFQLGVGIAEFLPWLLRPLLPLVAIVFHVGVWIMMHICFGGHAWVWCLCVDIFQPVLRLLAGPVTMKPRAPEAVRAIPKTSPETSDGESAGELYGSECPAEPHAEVRPKAAAAAAFCTIGTLAVAIRGCVSTWVPLDDLHQWPFSFMGE